MDKNLKKNRIWQKINKNLMIYNLLPLKSKNHDINIFCDSPKTENELKILKKNGVNNFIFGNYQLKTNVKSFKKKEKNFYDLNSSFRKISQNKDNVKNIGLSLKPSKLVNEKIENSFIDEINYLYQNYFGVVKFFLINIDDIEIKNKFDFKNFLANIKNREFGYHSAFSFDISYPNKNILLTKDFIFGKKNLFNTKLIFSYDKKLKNFINENESVIDGLLFKGNYKNIKKDISNQNWKKKKICLLNNFENDNDINNICNEVYFEEKLYFTEKGIYNNN